MKRGLANMLSVDDFVTQVKAGVRIKCNNVIERIECIEILDDVGFDASHMYEIFEFNISKWSNYLYVGGANGELNCFLIPSGSIIQFSEIPKDTASSNEEFCEAINELLFA